jgi:miniconductance mechanosensitive channel
MSSAAQSSLLLDSLPTSLVPVGLIAGQGTSAPPPDDRISAAPTEKSEFERELAATIQENPIVAWMREHPLVYHGAATGVTLLVVLLLYAALRAVFFLPLLRLLTRRSIGASRGSAVVRAINDSKLVNPLAWVLPFLVGWRGIYLWPGLVEWIVEILGRVFLGVAIAFGLLAFARFLGAVDLLVSDRLKRPGALRGYVQAITAIVGVVGGITIIAIMLGRSPVFFLGGVGAFAALLAVVLRDTLLSMWANILMTTGDTLRVGDWIEMRQHGIDGRVEDIRLVSTRVRNWDQTTLVVPNHRFVSEIFVNYRTQNAKGGRRFRRTIRLDARSIRPLGPEEIARAAALPELTSAVESARDNARRVGPAGEPRITNLCLYRAYVEKVAGGHPLVDRSRPIIVRQHEPSGTGVPLDVLFFLEDSSLDEYESVQAVLLDHLLDATAAFGLRTYQIGADPDDRRDVAVFLAAEHLALLMPPR